MENSPLTDRANWITLTLPYHEQGAVFQLYDPSQSTGGGATNFKLNSSNIPIMQCPSDVNVPPVFYPGQQIGPYVAQAASGGQPRLRVPQRDQIEMRWASLDQLLPPDHEVRVVWEQSGSWI